MDEIARTIGWIVRLREVTSACLESAFGMQDCWDLTAFYGDFSVYVSFGYGATKRASFRWGSIALRQQGLDADGWVRLLAVHQGKDRDRPCRAGGS